MVAARLSGLAGRTIGLTRPREHAGDFEAIVSANGGTPILLPAITIEEPDDFSDLDAAIQNLAGYDWIVFTSASAVSAFAKRMTALHCSPNDVGKARIAVVGRVTAARVTSVLRTPDMVASGEDAISLAEDLGRVAGCRILFPRGNLARPDLCDILSSRGAEIDAPIAYNTVASEGAARAASAWREGSLDALLFASPSAVVAVRDALQRVTDAPHDSASPAIFCVGKTTAAAARDAGFTVAATPIGHSQQYLLETVSSWFCERMNTTGTNQ
jgi:uroporphyrinogen-III synthase